MEPLYACVWKFRVSRELTTDFENTYGSNGDWVQLFRRGEGYVRTELYRDFNQPGRYLTIDYWRSREAYEAFRSAFAEEIETLDRQCARLTEKETSLGSFDCLTSPNG